jgi:hypothetical protein
MPKWKKDETKFEVSVNSNPTRGSQVNIPKPVLERLGNPKRIRFVVKGKRIEVEET